MGNVLSNGELILNRYLCEKCDYSFFSNCCEHSICPSCGCEYLLVKQQLNAMIIPESNKEKSIKEVIKLFLKEKGISNVEVIIKIETEMDVSPWRYLSEISILDLNKSKNYDNFEDELKELINGMFEISSMEELNNVSLKY